MRAGPPPLSHELQVRRRIAFVQHEMKGLDGGPHPDSGHARLGDDPSEPRDGDQSELPVPVPKRQLVNPTANGGLHAILVHART